MGHDEDFAFTRSEVQPGVRSSELGGPWPDSGLHRLPPAVHGKQTVEVGMGARDQEGDGSEV